MLVLSLHLCLYVLVCVSLRCAIAAAPYKTAFFYQTQSLGEIYHTAGKIEVVHRLAGCVLFSSGRRKFYSVGGSLLNLLQRRRSPPLGRLNFDD